MILYLYLSVAVFKCYNSSVVYSLLQGVIMTNSFYDAQTLEEFLALPEYRRDYVVPHGAVFVRQWFACAALSQPSLRRACTYYAKSTQSDCRNPRCAKHGVMAWIGTEFVMNDGTHVRAK